MSRNYDLMQEIERERSFRSNGSLKPAIPVAPERKAATYHSVDTSDSTACLVQKLFPRNTPANPRVVLFAGIDHGSGCSQIACSVAATLAGYAPGAVCLVEANFRSPTLSEFFATPTSGGLTDALLEDNSIRAYLNPIGDHGLRLLSAGTRTDQSPTLLASERMKTIFTELRREFDFVIVDAPPITRYADAIALGQLSDGIVVVIEAESTRRNAAVLAVENLRSSNVQILGAVLNKRIFPIPEKIYRRL